MSLELSPTEWGSLETADDARVRNEEPPRGALYTETALALNHIAQSNRRVLFNQHVPLASVPDDPISNLYRGAYNQNNHHGEELCWRIIACDINSIAATGTPAFSADTGTEKAYDAYGAANATKVELTDTHPCGVVHNVPYGSMTGTLQPWSFTTEGDANFSARAVSVALVERSDTAAFLDTANGATALVVGQYAPGSRIKTAPVASVRTMSQHLFDKHRPVLAAWSCVNTGATTNARTTASTHATGVNLIDGTTTARSTTSGGVHCPVYKGARYAPSGASALPATATVGVYASQTGGDHTSYGEVKFISSLNTVTISAIQGAAAWYWSSDGALELDDTLQGGDKVDIFGRLNDALLNLYVYAWCIQCHPV